MVEKEFRFGIHWQRSVLSRILKDRSFAASSIPIITSQDFDGDALKWISYRITKKGATSIRILVDMLGAEIRAERIDDDLKSAIAEELKVLHQKDASDDAKYGLERLKQFLSSQRLSDGILQAAQRVRDGDNSSAVKAELLKVIGDDFADETTETVNFIATRAERFKRRQDLVDNGELIFVPTGLKGLDEKIRGPRFGQYWSWFGDTNIGKSGFGVSMGAHATIKGYRVWHVFLEDLMEVSDTRYDACFSRISYDKFVFCNHSDREKERIDKVFKILEERRRNNLYVSKMEDGSTFNDIIREHNRLKNVEKFFPQVIIIDSPHSMEPDQKRENMRLNVKQIYLEGRKFTRREKVAMHFLDQSNQAVKGKIADTRASSEGYDKARLVDGFITINQTKAQRREGLIEFYVAKMKDRAKGMSIISRPNMKIMRFDTVEE